MPPFIFSSEAETQSRQTERELCSVTRWVGGHSSLSLPLSPSLPLSLSLSVAYCISTDLWWRPHHTAVHFYAVEMSPRIAKSNPAMKLMVVSKPDFVQLLSSPVRSQRSGPRGLRLLTFWVLRDLDYHCASRGFRYMVTSWFGPHIFTKKRKIFANYASVQVSVMMFDWWQQGPIMSPVSLCVPWCAVCLLYIFTCSWSLLFTASLVLRRDFLGSDMSHDAMWELLRSDRYLLSSSKMVCDVFKCNYMRLRYLYSWLYLHDISIR